MANQSPYQPNAPAYSMSNRSDDIDIQSLDSEYLSSCVRFAQSYGRYPAFSPSTSHPDTSLLDHDQSSQPSPRFQNTNFAFDHQNWNPSGSSGHYPDPYTRNTYADTYDPQRHHDYSIHPSPYMETPATDPNYAQHNGNFSILNDDDRNVDPNYFPGLPNNPQLRASNPFADDTTTQSFSDHLHSTPAPIKRPRKVRQPRHLSNTSEIGDKGLAVLHNYDPLWVQNTGADRSSVFEFSSKMKFEELFANGVIQKGDKLIINYSHVFSDTFDKEVATLTVCDSRVPPLIINFAPANKYRFSKQHIGFSRPDPLQKTHSTRFFPDFTLTLSSHPSYTQTILACKGTQGIMTGFAKIDIGGPEINAQLARNLHVWRGDRDLGTFLFVRQAWHTWKNRMDAEMQGKGTSWRARKGDPKMLAAVGTREGKGRGLSHH